MSNFNPNQIAITSTTFYPNWYRGKLKSIKHTDKIRGDLALEFINQATKTGYKVVIVDGKSSKSFKKNAASNPNIIFKNRRSPKRSPAKRQSFKIASQIPDVKVIITTEPEKIDIINSIGKIAAPILKNIAQIVIPKREESSFQSSYPKYQYESEIEGNKLYNEYLRANDLLKDSDVDLDMFFGPRAFVNDRKILSLFMRKFKIKVKKFEVESDLFDPEELSNAGFFPIVTALKKKLKVESVEIPFTYPKLQKENEEIGSRELFLEKRRNQRLGLLLELIHFLSFGQR